MLKKIMKKANEKKNQKGFTLIELLAVIVILAILAAIAIPSVTSIIHKQNDKAAVQDGLTIIHAAKLYVAENNITSSSNENDRTMDQSELKNYLENTNNKLPSEFSVKVEFDNTDKTKATYTITDEKLPSDLTDKTEQGLIKYNGGNPSTSTGS
ncbi:prepilin-type N-terminal cleavage/methylation domain-containing protein [Sporolactobacillus inulinus]|uniref:Type IV pilin PilA n=2 Tax=Sporolactobacillus inulinus TaxID=2078 RepID=A0A4Y3T516_9BACL|nr:prepilin-type N-terminal cleavage/methylation domain-containing protein [Sporolactobacillus inulinus]KLI03196.1 hypothetical protein SINU_03860 [Sporolactobacillus inulinus CASD]GAY78562.1 type IV pilin PilA [Sporolactobacillus inulinus]GEB76185.1 hypothetical protein SIN01_05300 [Sporolactobacillus inulinus]